MRSGHPLSPTGLSGRWGFGDKATQPLSPDLPFPLNLSSTRGALTRGTVARRNLEQIAKGKGWLIFPRGPSSPLLERTPCGIILVRPDQPAQDTGPVAGMACELFVWMRGAYRNTGLGCRALGKVLNQLRGEWRDPFTLYVRLPVVDLTGPGAELQKRMWMPFFHHYDFVQSGPEAGARAEVEIRLERRFPAVS